MKYEAALDTVPNLLVIGGAVVPNLLLIGGAVANDTPKTSKLPPI